MVDLSDGDAYELHQFEVGLRSKDPAEPPELRSLPVGVTEWMTHPGYPDPESGSEYDLARREDLDEILRSRVRERFDKPVWGEDVVRTTHQEAFAHEGGPLQDARDSI